MAEPQAIGNDELSPVDDIDFLTDWLSAPENIATGGEPYSAVRQRYNEVAMMDEDNPLPAWKIPADIQQINPTEGMGFFGKMRESFTGTARETGATESAFNYTDMPEVVEGLGATDAAGKVGKSVFGNAMIAQAAPEEMAASPCCSSYGACSNNDSGHYHTCSCRTWCLRPYFLRLPKNPRKYGR